MVAVAGSPSRPVIVDRQRIQIAEALERGPIQPYHAARELGADRGRVFLEECREACHAVASASLETALKRIGGDRVRCCAVLTGSGRPAATLAATLASHPAIHTAEGEFFREVVLHSAVSCGLPVVRIKEKELFDLAGRKFGMTPENLQRMLNELSKIMGPPWQQDQKFAALAAWLAAIG
jgi:hypothetical protein